MIWGHYCLESVWPFKKKLYKQICQQGNKFRFIFTSTRCSRYERINTEPPVASKISLTKSITMLRLCITVCEYWWILGYIRINNSVESVFFLCKGWNAFYLNAYCILLYREVRLVNRSLFSPVLAAVCLLLGAGKYLHSVFT